MTRPERHLVHHVVYLFGSILLAYAMVRSGALHSFIAMFDELSHVGSLVAGLFFASIFTTAPAVVVLGELAQETPLLVVAIFGAIGAVCGDYILFLLVRGGVSGDVSYISKHAGLKRYTKIFRTKLFHRILPLVGAFIIASPLPDELGLTLLGLSKVPKERFLLISFLMNALGILMIGLVARSFS